MSDFCFPFKSPPSVWWTGGRAFGANRDRGRKHGGCDIIKPVGETIHAVADGVLVHEETDFYMETNYITFRHGPYLIRYGEIMKGSTNRKKKGWEVKKGQPIAKVGQLIDSKGRKRGNMLHFEMYARGNDPSTLRSNTGPYMRRADIMNPGPFLDKWVKNLPK
jgi:murein DD-endopeptidase MepM/ murein hydrolase activator NlpD